MEKLRLFNTEAEYDLVKDSFEYPTVAYILANAKVKWMDAPDSKFYGKDYIDFDLPSGTLWAKKNIGADTETDYGLYFSWGDTKGYPIESDGNNGYLVVNYNGLFVTDLYKFFDESETSNSYMNKYNNTDNKTQLELLDDAASYIWHGEWHIPTITLLKELMSNTKNGFVHNGHVDICDWFDDYGKLSDERIDITGFNNCNGFIFFKQNVSDIANAILNEDYMFIPTSGLVDHHGIGVEVDITCIIWSNTISVSKCNSSLILILSTNPEITNMSRGDTGVNIRAVIDGDTGTFTESS